MKDINFKVMILLSFLLRVFMCLCIANSLYAFIYSFVFISIYYSLRNYNLGYIVMIVMLDYLFTFYLTTLHVGENIHSLLISVICFVIMNSMLYFVLINKIGFETSSKALKKKSNVYVDKGIEALENDNVDIALSEFKNAIKSHKKNYLGYMGMCDALNKTSKKDLKKFKYYKKKCIKYAPSELKENIARRYE